MTRKALYIKNYQPKKYKIRYRHRCRLCGRPRGYLKKFDMCRICFRLLAHTGVIPGVKKASW